MQICASRPDRETDAGTCVARIVDLWMHEHEVAQLRQR
jgi:hypothetical protein